MTQSDSRQPAGRRALVARPDGQLRHAADRTGQRARRGRRRRRRQGVPRPARRHRRQRARPRPPGDRRRRSPSRSPPSATCPTSSPTPRCWIWPRSCWTSAAPGGDTRPGHLRQLRRRGQRGRVQDGPAAPAGRGSSPPRAPSTAAPWARSRMTGQPAKRAPFEPMPPGVEFVPYGDIAALQAAVDDTVAAVFLEPILGEAGVVPASRRLPGRRPEDHRRTRRAAGHRRGADRHRPHRELVRHTSVPASCPTSITLAKGLGGGLPIGAAIGIGDAAHLLQPGQHGSTFAGNPVCAAAALAVLRHHRDRRSARPCRRARQAHRHRRRGSRPPADRRRPRAGLLLGIVLTERSRARQPLSPPGTPDSSSTHRPRT